MQRIVKHSIGNKTLTPELQKELDAFHWREYSENLDLSRKPRIALPPQTTPYLNVSLYVMQHKVNKKSNDISSLFTTETWSNAIK